MLREYRKKRKLTQEKLAELIDVDTRTIQRIESGDCDPSLKTLRKLINILQISDEDIIIFMKEMELIST